MSIELKEEEESSPVRPPQCSPNVRSRQSTDTLAQLTQALPSSLLHPLLSHQLHPQHKGLDNDHGIQLPNLLSRDDPRLANLHLSLIRHLILPLEAQPFEQSPPKLDSRMCIHRSRQRRVEVWNTQVMSIRARVWVGSYELGIVEYRPIHQSRMYDFSIVPGPSTFDVKPERGWSRIDILS